MNDGKKVSFTKEFLEKTKYHRPRSRRGEILERFNALTEEDLAKCQTRTDLARKLGYTTETMKKGNTMIGNLVRNKKLLEYPLGYNIGKAKAFSFSFPSNDPRVKVSVSKPKIDSPVETIDTTPKKLSYKPDVSQSTAKIEITFSDMTISLEEPTSEIVGIVFEKLNLLRKQQD